jgi:hypothetical protein
MPPKNKHTYLGRLLSLVAVSSIITILQALILLLKYFILIKGTLSLYPLFYR